MRQQIDWALLKPDIDLNVLMTMLKTEGIDTVLRQNNAGVIYGVTYVDHVNKVVFNGSDLGKGYSAKAIIARCGDQSHLPQKSENIERQEQMDGESQWRGERTAAQVIPGMERMGAKSITDALLQPEFQPERMDFELKRKRKKHKKMRID